MRTTVTLPDPLLVRVKQLAAARRTSVTAIIVQSLDRYLADARDEGTAPIEPLPTIKRAKPLAGVNLDDTSALWELD
jgi:hypothetical protein